MRNLTSFLFSLLTVCTLADEPWRLRLVSEEGVELHIDLYEESVAVPGMTMFGPMNGYLGGRIYGVWPVTSFEIKDDKEANLRVSNDLGSEAQHIRLVQATDTTWVMTFEGHNAIRKVNGKKLEKVPSRYVMRRK
ncbi:MAG: hypothetical protein HUK03_02300 [Bacteroidaceae bacterium]|nr:hypothetical protein [Bacteroidaceae bacterium]